MKTQIIHKALVDFADELKHLDASKILPVAAQFVANNKKTLWRYQTLYTKEPATIDWLNQLSPDDVLWDVGANIGLYTIYAALVRGARVVGFEPGSANYWVLNENIRVNKLQGKAQALCVALSDRTLVDGLHMRSTSAGETLNQTKAAVDDHGRSFKAEFQQAILLVKADDLIDHFNVPPPTSMKVDVDGAELDVLKGAAKLIRGGGLRRISLEMNRLDEGTVSTATSLLEECGFSLIGSHHSPLAADVIRNYHFVR